MIFLIPKDAKDVLDLFGFLMKDEMIRTTVCKVSKDVFCIPWLTVLCVRRTVFIDIEVV